LKCDWHPSRRVWNQTRSQQSRSWVPVVVLDLKKGGFHVSQDRSSLTLGLTRSRTDLFGSPAADGLRWCRQASEAVEHLGGRLFQRPRLEYPPVPHRERRSGGLCRRSRRRNFVPNR